MKLRIVGDGTYKGTRVETLDGEFIQGVKDIKINMENDDLLHAHLNMYFIPVEIEAEIDSINLVDHRFMGDRTWLDDVWGKRLIAEVNDHEYPCPVCNHMEYLRQVKEGKIKPFSILKD